MSEPITDEQYTALETRLAERQELRRQLDAVLAEVRALQERRIALERALRERRA